MARATLAALALVSATAFAQTPPASAKSDAPSVPQLTPAQLDEVRKEVDARVDTVKKELREEMRAQQATQAAAQGWQDEWVEEKRKLELITLDGYFRVRPELFYKFGMHREPDPTGAFIWPRSPVAPTTEQTNAGANMRLRLAPTINVSEQVRVHLQVDALDNVVMGSSPEYTLTRPGIFNQVEFPVQSVGQTVPHFGVLGSLTDSVAVKRVYGEVTTPVGILRFGRMGSQWGLGMLHNDGNCLDCDYGDTVDRIQFVANPFPGWYIAPMLDFNLEGPTGIAGNPGQPFDLSNSDDSHSYVIAIARRDTDQEARAKLDNGQAVFNFGLHFEYRSQRNDPIGFLQTTIQSVFNPTVNLPDSYVSRHGQLFIPDLWAKYEKKNWRVEAELAGVFGSIRNRALTAANFDQPNADQPLTLTQFGAVLQGEYRFLDGKLKVGGEVGFASGDSANGLGNQPGVGSTATGQRDPNFVTPAGAFNGPQYQCGATAPFTCPDSTINNFIFNRDYRIDSILWREILGPVTDAIYVKPQVSYDLTEGLRIFGDVVYSRTVFGQSSPNGTVPDLAIELEAGARYESEDGFIGGLTYGIVIPLAGLTQSGTTSQTLENAQALRGWLGVKF